MLTPPPRVFFNCLSSPLKDTDSRYITTLINRHHTLPLDKPQVLYIFFTYASVLPNNWKHILIVKLVQSSTNAATIGAALNTARLGMIFTSFYTFSLILEEHSKMCWCWRQMQSETGDVVH